MNYYKVYPNLYVCLVGDQANRKTVAKDIAYDLLRKVAPELPVSGESMSKEAITKHMSQLEQLRTYTDQEGNIIEYHPFSIFATELKNFLSINITTMLDFLTTIYDRKFYDVITKNKGTDVIVNPYVVVLACEVPQWIQNRLKDDIISGGICRRFVWVYEIDYQPIAFPCIPPGGLEAWDRVEATLVRLKSVAGEFQFSPKAREFYDHWYYKNFETLPTEPFMRGYRKAKHIQMLKVAILLSLCEGVDFILEAEHIQAADLLLQGIEPNMLKLSEGVGRNVLAGPAARIVEIILASGGMMFEKKIQMEMFRELQPIEFFQVLEHLKKTEQVFAGEMVVQGVTKRVVMTKEYYEETKRKQQEDKKKD